MHFFNNILITDYLYLQKKPFKTWHLLPIANLTDNHKSCP